LSSCATSINYLSIQVLEPASITFPPEVTNVLIVDNTPVEEKEKDKKKDNNNNQDILTIDSTKTILLNSLRQFMNEEKYFNNVDLYPYKTNSTSVLKDATPLTRRKVQAICRDSKADALVSLDFFVISAQIQSENVAYFTDYSVLEAKIGTIMRVYSKNGDQYSAPLGYIDSLYREGPAPWDIRRNNIEEINVLLTDIAIVGADKLTGTLIPSWKSYNRWYYPGGSAEMKKATEYVKSGKWQEAADIWENVYATETKTDNKIKLATNLALAYECLDNVENAYEWIEKAANMLPKGKKSAMATMTNLYFADLLKRKSSIATLQQQLGIEDTPEGDTE